MAGLRSLRLSSFLHHCRGRRSCRRGRWGCGRVAGGRRHQVRLAAVARICGLGGGAESGVRGAARGARGHGRWPRADEWVGGGPEGRGGALGGSRCRRRPPPPLLPARPQTRSLFRAGELPAAAALS